MAVAKQAEPEVVLSNLRNALRHWQSLEIDYQGLVDEFSGLDNDATRDDILNAARAFAPDKVDNKEIKELIEPKPGQIRQPDQIIHLLKKRGEWVATNIDTLQKQIEASDTEQGTILGQNQRPSFKDESELPVFEITETLDDDGNVLSSNTQPHGKSASTVLNVLDQAGIDSGHKASKQSELVPKVAPLEPENSARVAEIEISPGKDDADSDVDIISDTLSALSNPNDTEEEALLRQEMLQYGGLQEIGNIVAELELAEGSRTGTDEDDNMSAVSRDTIEDGDYDSWDDDDVDDDDEDVSTDEEDDSGRSTRISDRRQRQKQIEELQKQAVRMENLGPQPDLPQQVKEQIEVLAPAELETFLTSIPPSMRQKLQQEAVKVPAKEAARQAAIAREEANRTAEALNKKESKSKPKKSVKFASELDIANETKPSPSQAVPTNNDIIERSPSEPLASAKPTSTRTSRFRADRITTTTETPAFPPSFQSQPKPQPDLGPSGKTIADKLVERPAISTNEPPDPDDFDEELQKRQIALEHHRIRNRMIHEQGGYVEEREEIVPPEIVDERTGEPRKVSRFKAARLMR